MADGTPRGKALTVYIVAQIEDRLDAILKGKDEDMRDAAWALRLNLTELRMTLEREMEASRLRLSR